MPLNPPFGNACLIMVAMEIFLAKRALNQEDIWLQAQLSTAYLLTLRLLDTCESKAHYLGASWTCYQFQTKDE